MDINVEKQVAENMKNVVVNTAEEFGKTITLVTVTMKNGFTIHECIASDPSNYDKERDAMICCGRINDKMRLIFSYLLQDKVVKEKKSHKTFKPFQKVLVKVMNEDDNHVWIAAIYSHYNESKGRHYFSNMQWTDDDSYIIPFEGNEDKLGQIAE